MENREKNKWKVRGAVLAIFLLGFVAGILALNVYHKLSNGGQRQTDGRGGERIEQIFERLALTEAQQAEIRGVFDSTRIEMREMRRADAERRKDVRRRTDERLQKILTPEQWQQFQQIRNEGGGSKRGGRSPNRE